MLELNHTRSVRQRGTHHIAVCPLLGSHMKMQLNMKKPSLHMWKVGSHNFKMFRLLVCSSQDTCLNMCVV